MTRSSSIFLRTLTGCIRAAGICFCACCIAVAGSPCFSAATEAEEGSGGEIVSCADGLMKIDAKDIRPEDLIKEIGDKCGIKIVVFGEAFSENSSSPVSLKFQKMPVRRGIERVLRTISLPNFVLHFDAGDNNSRLFELDIVGKKGGEKQLTAGAARPSPATTTVPVPQQSPRQEPPQVRRDEKKEAKADLTKEETGKMQENFLKIMDEVLKNQESGEEPDPGEILKLFRDAVPPDMKDQIPPEVMEELEKLEGATKK